MCVTLAEAPPVLFEVTYHEGIQIGGNPFHFIYTPSHKKHRGTHHICSLKDSTLVWTIDHCWLVAGDQGQVNSE